MSAPWRAGGTSKQRAEERAAGRGREHNGLKECFEVVLYSVHARNREGDVGSELG